MNWHEGDMAILVHFEGDVVPSTEERFFGEECEIICPAFLDRHDWIIRVCGELRATSERHLRKPYDGHEKCEWKDCIFQPKVLELVER